ncbi:MAG: thiamine pyrophosphate-binding protein [Firmicutes bacterium]|nr:thiamine pyrophosphate-binding protein [Bacillota bacterium]
MSETVAQVMVKALHYWGIKNIYGVSGDAILPFMDALGRQDNIKFYSTATEQGAAFMACGEARITGNPGVCLATEGPGALNLLNGVADAYRDGVPMLVITGQVKTAKIATNAKQYFNQQHLFAPITGFTTLLTRPESVIETLKIALEKAIGDNTPCHVSIPQDILLSPINTYQIPPLNTPCPPALSGNVDDVVNLLLSSRNPLIIAGKAAIPVKEKVYHLVRHMGAAVIPGQGARGIFSGLEDFLVGGLGECHIPPILNQADCILLIGSSPYEYKFVPKKTVIQVDTRPQNLAHQLNPLSVTGNMALALDLITEGLKKYKCSASWQEKVKRHHQEFNAMIKAEANLLDKPISARKVISILNETIPEDAIVVIDSGEFMHWFDRGFIPKRQTVIISDYWRCMGCGLPFGLGAQVAHSEKKVVILAGEGGFMMTMQEMLTATRYALPVVIVVFNNGRYLLEEHRMQKAGMVSFGVDVYAPHFFVLAEACGVKGLRVEDPGELRGLLNQAMSYSSTVLVDVIVKDEKPAFI